MEETVPPALVLGCNTPHGIGVLSDWIEERTGVAPDFVDKGWTTNSYDLIRVDGSGDGSGYAGFSDGSGYGVGCGYGNKYGNGFGDGYGGGNGDGHSVRFTENF